MEICDRTSQYQNGRELLLRRLYKQLETEKQHSKTICLQRQIDEIVAERYLLYINGGSL